MLAGRGAHLTPLREFMKQGWAVDVGVESKKGGLRRLGGVGGLGTFRRFLSHGYHGNLQRNMNPGGISVAC